MKYNVHVRLDCTYWDIESDSADEAFEIATQYAIEGGTWDYNIEKVDEEEVLDDKN